MNILIADDHPLYRDALSMLVSELAKDVHTITAKSYNEVIQLSASSITPDLILLDLHMPGMDAWQGIATLKDQHPDIPLVIISSSQSEDEHRKAIEYGAQGFIPKSLEGESLLNALRLIIDNGITLAPVPKQPSPPKPAVKLTNRQLQVLENLAHGDSNKVIAKNLGLSEGTVKLHVRAIFTALSVSNRTQAAIAGEKLGLINTQN